MEVSFRKSVVKYQFSTIVEYGAITRRYAKCGSYVGAAGQCRIFHVHTPSCFVQYKYYISSRSEAFSPYSILHARLQNENTENIIFSSVIEFLFSFLAFDFFVVRIRSSKRCG